MNAPERIKVTVPLEGHIDESQPKIPIPPDVLIYILFGSDPRGGLDRMMRDAGVTPTAVPSGTA